MSGDVDKTAQSISPATGRGLREFFRRKSNSGSSRNLDTAGVGDAEGSATANTSLESQDGNSLTVDADLSASTYGNYLTVSGTGAHILKDIFQKKYRARGSQDSSEAAERERKKKISFGQTTFFGFRLRKEKAHDGAGAGPDSEAETRARLASKVAKDSRIRHKSGPEQQYHTVGGSDSESRSKPGKMKTFLDSFRMHSKSESSSTADPAVLVRQLRSYDPGAAQKSVVGKGKKFLVTPAKKDKDAEIGPQEFIEMYRNRAFSDSRPQDLLAARAAARHHKMSTGFSPFGRYSNGLEISGDKRHYVVWRDKRKGTKIYQLPSAQSVIAVRDEFGDPNDANLAFVRFLKSHCCYDLIPSSSKLVIFDTQLTVKKAFLALVQNGVRAAVLWDTAAQDFAGMLTVSDFIQVLQKYYHSSQEELSRVENDKILTWKELLEYKRRLMVCINPESSLFDAIKTLHDNKVHRLLVVDDRLGNPLNLLSHKRIARFLHQHMRYLQRPSFMDKTLAELNVGTYENLGTLQTDAPLIEALNLFVLRRVSAIPVVDSEGRAVDMFAKIDIVVLIHEQLYNNLDVSVMEVLKGRARENFQGVLTCKRTDTLQKTVDQIVTSAVHRLIVVDDDERVVGIVSLSDILHYLVLLQSETRKSSSCDQLNSIDFAPDAEQDDSEPKTFESRSLLELKDLCSTAVAPHSSSDPNLAGAEPTVTSAEPTATVVDSTATSEPQTVDESSSELASITFESIEICTAAIVTNS